ncbi:MAG: FAD-dependent monooxygenase [Paracoccaceae bacterium]
MSDQHDPAQQYGEMSARQHAVIIGGGIGGLLAAHALADRYTEVTILERSHYPEAVAGTVPPARQGVPQGHCLHLLMGAGVRAFDVLAPNWRREAVARGAIPFDACADVAMRFPSGWLPRSPSGIEMYACSRSLLEDVLRTEILERPNVTISQGCQVAGLLTDPTGKQVSGVCRAVAPADEETIFANLVVDASGAASRLQRWIGDIPGGSDLRAKETVIESGRKYVSCWFHLDPGDAPDWQCLAVSPTAKAGHRAAMMLRAENDFWGVVLLATNKDDLPKDHREFLDFVESLDDPQFRKVLEHAKPVSEIHHYGRTASRTRHYDQLGQWPNGLVAIADSVCALDPYYGLGMTAAARSALLLAEFVDKHDNEILSGLDFQKELAELNAEPWQIATGHDQSGGRLRYDKEKYGRLFELAPSDSDVALAILKTQHLLLPLNRLMERQLA